MKGYIAVVIRKVKARHSGGGRSAVDLCEPFSGQTDCEIFRSLGRQGEALIVGCFELSLRSLMAESWVTSRRSLQAKQSE